MSRVVCVDVGSTFTKGLLVETADGAVIAAAEHPTTSATDVLTGLDAVHQQLDAAAPVVACSSAGGGLRLAVVGYERAVTAEAGHRVGLSAGAKVVHVAAGPLSSSDLARLRASQPDVVLLVGGTDGGNADVLLHNALRLSRLRRGIPVVVAGNADATAEAAGRLGDRVVLRAENVLPRIGLVEPDEARAAIREVFVRHVIGGKGLSTGRRFGSVVRAATPDAVLSGVGVLAAEAGADVIVVDVGGATTDVYSSVTPQGEDAALRKEIVAPLRLSRTVEGDLGVRWGAAGVVEAAASERLPVLDSTAEWAARVADEPGLLAGVTERALDLELARAAVTVALRRHGRACGPTTQPRRLRDVAMVVGSGGVLRHATRDAALRALAPASADHGAGWVVPERARTVIDNGYVLFAAGLLAADEPEAAAGLARSLLR